MKENFDLITDRFPADIMMGELMDNWELFGQVRLRTDYPGSSHREVEDILLRGPDDLTRPPLELFHELKCVDYEAGKQLPFALDLAHKWAEICEKQLGRVMITKLPPGKMIYEHADEGMVPAFYDRWHGVIQGYPGNVFTVDDEEQEMLTGELWHVNVRKTHTALNGSSVDRIHFIVDIAA